MTDDIVYDAETTILAVETVKKLIDNHLRHIPEDINRMAYLMEIRKIITAREMET